MLFTFSVQFDKWKIIPSSRIASLATSDSFPTSEQSFQNSHFEDFNSTGVASKSDNDQALPSDVLKEVNAPSDQLDEETLVESRTYGAQIENVIERNDLSKEKLDVNIDTGGIAEAILLDTISTNSGING